MPLVSVVVPTYNRAETLPRAIDSALAQTVDDLEIVVVDDGSTDRTGEVLEGYGTDRVRTVTHETNHGANVARNTGIDYADGEYVAFLDSDDEWRPTKLERQLELLDSRSDEWVAAYCGFTVETPGTTGSFLSTIASVLALADDDQRMEGGEELLGDILADNVHPGAGSTLIVETGVVREIGGFDEDLERFQDPEIVIRILKQGKIAYVDEPLVVRYDTGNPSAELVERASRQYLAAYEDDVNRLEAEGYAIRGSHELVLAKHYFADGKPLRGLSHLRHASVPPRHYPGVVWTAALGLRRRPTPIVVLALSAIALVVVDRFVRSS